MAFLVMLGREILMDVRDVQGDALARMTLPMKIGVQKAIYVGCLPVLITVILTPVPYFVGIFRWWYLVVVVPADVLFILAMLWVLKDRKNVGITTDTLRTGSAVALGAFIIGLV